MLIFTFLALTSVSYFILDKGFGFHTVGLILAGFFLLCTGLAIDVVGDMFLGKDKIGRRKYRQ